MEYKYIYTPMNTILKASYHRLLADIARMSGVPIGTPDDNVLEWILIKGPSLDKYLTELIEKDSGILYPSVVLDCSMFGHLISLAQAFFDEHIQAVTPGVSLRSKMHHAILAGRYLRLLRQGLLFCYKAEFEPTKSQEDAAVKQFLDCDDDMALVNQVLNVWYDGVTKDSHTLDQIVREVFFE